MVSVHADREGLQMYFWQPAAMRKETFRLGPWLYGDRLSPMVPLSVQLTPYRVAQMVGSLKWLLANAEWLFSLQIKYPFTAIALQEILAPLATCCHAERKSLRLGLSGFATPIFHRLCLCLYLYPFTEVMHTEFYDLFCWQTRRTAYTVLCLRRTEILPDPLLQYTITLNNKQIL